MARGVLPSGTVFHEAPLSYEGIEPRQVRERLRRRAARLAGALRATARTGLVFLDLDNGLAPPGAMRHWRASLRYPYPDEVRPFLERGQAVVLIQFLTRDGPHVGQFRDHLRRATEALPPCASPHFALRWRRGASVAFLVFPACRGQAMLLGWRARATTATAWRQFFSPMVRRGRPAPGE